MFNQTEVQYRYAYDKGAYLLGLTTFSFVTGLVSAVCYYKPMPKPSCSEIVRNTLLFSSAIGVWTGVSKYLGNYPDPLENAVYAATFTGSALLGFYTMYRLRGYEESKEKREEAPRRTANAQMPALNKA